MGVNCNVCRLCLSSRGELVPIFHKDNTDEAEKPVLASKIQACVSIQINEDDELPTQVCRKCVDNVNNWHTFKEICEKTQTKLHDLNNKSNSADENSEIKTESSGEDQADGVVIDGAYPDYQENVEKLKSDAPPPILTSLGLAPKNGKKKNPFVDEEDDDEDDDEDEEEEEEEAGDTVQYPRVPLQIPNMPEVSITVMRSSGDTIKTPQGIQQLASKDCLVCGRSYRYSHNARRHELSSHRFDRYTNKISKPNVPPKLMPNPFNLKARMFPNPVSQKIPFLPNQYPKQPPPRRPTKELPFPLKIKSLSDLQVKRKEPEILKTLLTSRPEMLVSEPEIMNSAPESPETLISEPEISSFQCETILTEPDMEDEDGNDSQNQPSIVEMDTENEMEIAANPHATNGQSQNADSDADEEHGDMEDENYSDVKSQDEEHETFGNGELSTLKSEVDIDEHDLEENMHSDGGDEDSMPIAPIVELKEGNQDYTNDGDEEHDEAEYDEAPEENHMAEQPEYDPNKRYLTQKQRDFLLEHRDIIEQINTKTCLCCRKEHPRRKAVIQHLQKMGHKVPKHTCYNCIITFDQIGALLSHMRANICTELWRIIYEENGVTDDMIIEEDTGLTKSQYRDIFNARSYACRICPAKFQIKHLITKHVQEFHDVKQNVPLVCAQCGSKFKEHHLWRRHIKNQVCTINIACEMCPGRFSSINEFSDHAIAVHATADASSNQEKCIDSRTTDCPICQKTNATFQQLVKHLKSVHNEDKPHYCNHCDSKFASSNELYEHIYNDHAERPQGPDLSLVKEEAEEYHYSCTECNAIFETVDAWTDHQVSEHNQIAYQCDLCEKKFLRPTELAEHKNEHLKVKFYTCSVCSNSYSAPEKLSAHVRSAHPEITANQQVTPDSQFYCELCSRSFKSRQAYSNHMRIHSKVPTTNRRPDQKGSKQVRQYPFQGPPGANPNFRSNFNIPNAPYSCDICGKGFMHKKNIWKHKKVLHADIVAQQEREKAGLTNNQPVIEAEEDFNQDTNGLGLSIPQFDSFNFDNYNVEPQLVMYKCDECPKQFPTNANLLKHKKMKHNPEQPLNIPINGPPPQIAETSGGRSSCTICKISFSDKKSYYRHRKNVHKANIQMCKICGKPYSSTLELYEHLKAAHARELLGYNASQVKPETVATPEVEDSAEDAGDEAQYQARYPCNACGKQFVGMLALQNHQCPGDTPKETYDCEICHKSYTSISALKSHRGWHLRSPDGKAAATNTGLWMPQNKVTSKVSKHEVIDPTHFSKFQTSTPDSLVGAKRRLPPEVEVTVVNPNKKLRSDDSADGEPSFRNDAFNADPLLTEIQGSFNESGDRYCGICDKEFTKKAAYQRHMDEVHQPNSVFCPVCDKSFTRKSTLLVHMRKHYENSDGEAPAAIPNPEQAAIFACDLCGMSYRSAVALRMHRVRHHGEGDSESGGEGSSKSQQHQPTMSAEFTCNQCGDGVATPRDLIAHRNWHSTPTKFFCNICKVYFPRALDLSAHTKSRHSDNEKVYFPCAMCDRFYMNKKSLQRHIEMAH